MGGIRTNFTPAGYGQRFENQDAERRRQACRREDAKAAGRALGTLLAIATIAVLYLGYEIVSNGETIVAYLFG